MHLYQPIRIAIFMMLGNA
nr:unnamed protein product [Callosobruchus chinensis]